MPSKIDTLGNKDQDQFNFKQACNRVTEVASSLSGRDLQNFCKILNDYLKPVK